MKHTENAGEKRNVCKSLAWKIHRNGLGITDVGMLLKYALEIKSVNRWTTQWLVAEDILDMIMVVM
jgi:hypothetical protein